MIVYEFEIIIEANDSIVHTETVESPSSMKAIASVMNRYQDDVRNFSVSARKVSNGKYVSESK